MSDSGSSTFFAVFKKLVPHSIRSKIIYCFLIPVLLIYLTSSFIEVNSRIAGLREKTDLIMRETVSEISYRILARSLSISSAVLTLADNYSFLSDESFISETGSEESVYKILKRTLNQNNVPIYGISIILDPDTAGKPYYHCVKVDDMNDKLLLLDYSTQKNKEGLLYTESDWYKTLKDNCMEIYNGKIGIWSHPFLSVDNQLLMHYSFPIVRNGKFAGVVNADISLNNLREQFRQYLPNDEIIIRMLSPNGRFCMVHTGEDSLVMGPTLLTIATEQNNGLLLKATEKVFAGMRNDETVCITCRDFAGGKDVMIAFASVSERIPGWILMATIPAKLINAPIEAQILRSVAFIIFFTLTIVVVGLVISHNINRSLKKLTYFTEELRKGKLHAKFEGRVFNKSDEIGNLARTFKSMAKAVIGRRRKLEQMQVVLINALSNLAEYRDPETGTHIKRTAIYAELLSIEAKKRNLMDTSVILKQHTQEPAAKIIARAAPLHDIGKVAIPDSILLKPDKLTREEFESMKHHVNYGVKALRSVIHELGEQSFLNVALEICAGHHERYDGNGYPNGLYGEDIPFAGRIMAIADVYDALTTERPYKKAFDHETAVNIIKEGSGTQFDPQLVDCFLAVGDEFAKVAQNYKDEESRFMDSAAV